MNTSLSFATCLPAMIAISQAVLSSRVAAGTRWLRLGLDSASPIDLEHVANLAPIPTLSTISATWMSRAWTAALAGKHSVFDTLTPSSSTLIDSSSSSTNSSPATNAKSLPLDKLVSKLVSYINVSPSVLITALILLDRLTTAVPEVLLNDGNVHKLYVVAFMTAAKLLEDDYNPASWFAAFLGCSEDHIKYLELLFLKGIDYHAFVTSQDFNYALHCFTTEAIDSPMALQVLASFPNCQIASRAVDLASSWKVYPCSNLTLSNEITSYRAEPPPSELCLRALADAQLSHDCPGFGTDNSWTDFASRIYSPIGFIRLMSLKRLIDGVLASSLLPALELNPHTRDGSTKIDGDIEDPNAKGRVILEGLGWGKLYKRGWEVENSKLVDSDLSVAPVYTAGSIWAL